MPPRQDDSEKKVFTVQQANATLPLVRAIVRDVTALAQELRERHQRLGRARAPQGKKVGAPSEAHQEELQQAEADLERGRERMQELERELAALGVELKDYFTGLVDFPAQMHGRNVYLCWRLGEPEVGHWHELEAGFAGRQKLTPELTGLGRPNKV
jgi:hypothetical protein